MNKNRKNTRKNDYLQDLYGNSGLTRTNLQSNHTRLYTDLKTINSANDVMKLTINDYIILRRETNLQNKYIIMSYANKETKKPNENLTRIKKLITTQKRKHEKK